MSSSCFWERYLFLVLSTGGVEGLDEGGGVAEEHGVAGGTHNHAEHGQPHVGHRLRGLGSVPDAQHVTHGLEQGVGVLHAPRLILRGEDIEGRETEPHTQQIYRMMPK